MEDIRASLIQPGVWSGPYSETEFSSNDLVEGLQAAVGINPLEVINLPPSVIKCKHIYIVPGGMGDIAWIYSKLYSLEEDLVFAISSGGKGGDYSNQVALRSLPFVSLLENVKYSSIAIMDGTLFCRISATASYSGKLPDSPAYLCFNYLLDHGVKLEEIFPSLPTVKHFPLKRPRWAEKEANLFLKSNELAFSIYPSSRDYYGGKNLKLFEWIRLIENISQVKPKHKIIILGAPWDLNLIKPLYDSLCAIGLRNRVVLVHDRDIAVSLDILRRCEFLLGAVSGLTIVSEYQKIPTIHLYPEKLYNEYKLLGTWESEEMIEKKQSLSLKMGDGIDSILSSILDYLL